MKYDLPIVAVLGRPNVGKSTLINRIAASMTAIVDSTPGVTRDRKYVRARWRDRDFIVADTGGVGIDGTDRLSGEVEKQAFVAAADADAIVMVVDVKTGISEDDLWLSRRLKRMKRDAVVAVNKVDNPSLEAQAAEFYSLGLGEPTSISAQHGLGIGDLLDRVVAELPPPTPSEELQAVSVAIVGRPNVGKSSILNALAREERVLVHEEPHTTRDTVDTLVTRDGRSYLILDTAGIRAKRGSMSDVEYYSSVRTFRAIDEAEVVLLIIDGAQGPTEHDQRIAKKVESRGRACIILINKFDLVSRAGNAVEVMESTAFKFRFAQHLPLLRTSAVTGRGIDKILPLVDEVYAQWNRRIPTPVINEFLASVKLKRSPPVKGGRQLKMYYVTQAGTAPPTFVIFVNDAGLVKADYRKFLARQIREEFGFWGSPVRVHFRTAQGGKGK